MVAAVIISLFVPASLLTMSIRAGVIVAVTFQQVDCSLDAKTGAKGHDESLQYTDCTVEKCHIEASFDVPPAGVD